MVVLAAQMAVALGLDWMLGEPRRLHPLVGLGAFVATVERLTRGTGAGSPASLRLRGVVALACVVVPPVCVTVVLERLPGISFPVAVVCLYLALGHRSLHDHGLAVAAALESGNEREARRLAARMVSRDPDAMHVPRATTESILENGSDAVFGALFWFLVAGAPGAVAYRVVNTLDALWGYRTARYLHFGRAAARLDDLLNLVPARLTALGYALGGSTRRALVCAWREGRTWEGPNAGVVMAAGAGALGIRLGGPANYAGRVRERPWLGEGPSPGAGDIRRALALVRRGVVWWATFAVLAGAASAIPAVMR